MGMSLGQLAVRFGCELQGDPEVRVERVATLTGADAGALSFLANPAYRSQLAGCRAGAVILQARDAAACPVPALVARDPYSTYAQVAAELHPPAPLRPGVHPSADVAAGAQVPASCQIDAGAVLGEGVILGERVRVGSHTVLAAGVRVGPDSVLMPAVTLYPGVRIGERCTLHAGVVVGSDGFGFARQADGSHLKVPQVGGVLIGDDVEIGANTTIDRGAIDDTVIGNGVKLDNQIQVGHNVRIGEHTVIAAHAGISGSTTIGARCIVGGKVGFAGHIAIVDDVVIGGGTSVTGPIRAPGVYAGGGTPADTLQRWRRNMARFSQLDEIARRLRELEKRMSGTADK